MRCVDRINDKLLNLLIMEIYNFKNFPFENNSHSDIFKMANFDKNQSCNGLFAGLMAQNMNKLIFLNNNEINKNNNNNVEQNVLILNIPQDNEIETIKAAVGNANEIYKNLVKNTKNSKLIKIIINIGEEKSLTKFETTVGKNENTDFRDSLRNSQSLFTHGEDREKKVGFADNGEIESEEKSINSIKTSQENEFSFIPVNYCMVNENSIKTLSLSSKLSNEIDGKLEDNQIISTNLFEPHIFHLECMPVRDKSKSCSSLPESIIGRKILLEDLTPSQLSILDKFVPKKTRSEYSQSTEIEFIEYSFRYEKMGYENKSDKISSTVKNQTSTLKITDSVKSNRKSTNSSSITVIDKTLSIANNSESQGRSKYDTLIPDNDLVLTPTNSISSDNLSSSEQLTITGKVFDRYIQSAKFCVDTPKEEGSSTPIFGPKWSVRRQECGLKKSKEVENLSQILSNQKGHFYGNVYETISDTALLNVLFFPYLFKINFTQISQNYVKILK